MTAPETPAERWARPVPTATDIATATIFVIETYDNDPAVSRRWLANHRSDLIRYASDAAMQKRQRGI